MNPDQAPLLDIDPSRAGLAITAGSLAALLATPGIQLAVAALVSAGATVLVDVVRALGRYVVRRLDARNAAIAKLPAPAVSRDFELPPANPDPDE